MAQARTDAPERFPLFDSARAIAALSVFAFHVSRTRPPERGSELIPYLKHLNFGVTIFFLISGFLLYRPFVISRLEGRPLRLGTYALRRFLRLVPGYWVALAVIIGVTETNPIVTDQPWTFFGFAQVYSTNTILQGIGQAWTLCIEVTFYVLLPIYAVVMALGRGERRPHWGRDILGLVGFAVFAYAWSASLHPEKPLFVWQFVLPRFLGHFALGMALALFTVWLREQRAHARALEWLMEHPTVTWLFVPVGYWASATRGWSVAVRDVIDGLTALAVLWPAVFAKPGLGIAGRVLNWRPLLYVGMVSYGFYLYHFNVVHRVSEELDGIDGAAGVLAVVVVALAGSVLVATWSWRFVERPAIEWGRHFTRLRRPEIEQDKAAP